MRHLSRTLLRKLLEMSCPQSVCLQLESKDNYTTKLDTEVEIKDGFDFGSALLTVFDINETILEYLPYCDLKSLSKINAAWKNRIDEYVTKRIEPNIFCFSQTLAEQLYYGTCTSKPALSILFFNDHLVKLHHYVCIHVQDIDVYKKPVVQFIENDILADELCPIVALSCKQSDLSLPLGLFFSGFILPDIPGVQISVVNVSKEKTNTTLETISSKLDSNFYVECVLAFSLPVTKSAIFKKLHTVTEHIQRRQPFHKFSFGGGLVTGVKTFNVTDIKKIKRSEDVLFVMLSIPKTYDVNFTSYSLKISETMIENDEVDDYFINFKKHFIRRKHNVALRFSCTSLDENISYVMSVFCENFPYMQISGFSCNGEIGWDNYDKKDSKPPDEEPETKKKKGKGEPLVNYFTIIFVILSWGKIIKQ